MMDVQQVSTFVAEAIGVAFIMLAMVAYPMTVWRSGRVERERRQRVLPGK